MLRSGQAGRTFGQRFGRQRVAAALGCRPGLKAASKYIYCGAGVAITVDWIASPWTSVALRDPHTGRTIAGGGRIWRAVWVACCCGERSLWWFSLLQIRTCGPIPCTGLPNRRYSTAILPRARVSKRSTLRSGSRWCGRLKPVTWPPGVFLVRLDTLITRAGGGRVGASLAQPTRVRALAHHRVGLFVGVAYQMAAVYEDGLRAALFGRGCGVPRACVGAVAAVDGPAPSRRTMPRLSSEG